MNETYLDRKKNSNLWLVWTLLIILVVVVLVIGYFFINGKDRMIRPIPAKPSFEVVFYTPTPGETIPTSSPSATPKVKATVKPTAAPKLTVTPKPTVTVAPKLSPTP
ncbi:hypothetical protein A3D03_00400 [Candidatus Gottesmanbacteria bacterium RIFCSPHIGHO2_02_FULL_40_13]|uniref:Uncharacterized protein n=1 Tax=Candidatus Gottesmanbacteria bacterium RIFCSPHIGHO2_02_FULL_40_13 TaxID=1798384 RepID=A0A1F6A7C3_9BACT|nr:MAG: hypothetical protein A3D03_00400 [Candidatus Gottesmanbacteria bacterium RIFCSPHIGHO2_02_FULL_40_13]